jgi:hypothetical protein
MNKQAPKEWHGLPWVTELPITIQIAIGETLVVGKGAIRACATNASLFPSGHVKKTRHYDQHRVIFPSDRR